MAIETQPRGGHNPTRGDIALAAALLGVAVLSGIYVDAARPDTVEPSQWWQWLLMATPPILVAFRRRNPALIAILATAAQAGIWISNLPEVLLGIIVILYTVASDGGPRGVRTAIGSSLVLTLVTAIGVVIADDVTAYQLPLIALTCGTAIGLGMNAARQRRTTRELATAVAEQRVRSEHERTRAATEERTHIARELHDVIGHTLSVIAVRAEAADRVAQEQPEAASDAVSAIASVARAALDETRQVLSGLRQSSAVELGPPPDLAATARLVTDLARTGIDATVSIEGCETHSPPGAVAGGAHRIVQESLTNAIKHGSPSTAITVQLGCSAGELCIRITNTCTGDVRGSDGAEAADGHPSRANGVGLIGMAERAAVLGGTLEARKVDDLFVVEATLPMRMTSGGGNAP